jgi:hypothetical protein
MRPSTQGLLLLGILLGSISAFGSVAGASADTWIAVAAVAAVVLTLGLVRAVEVDLPTSPPPAFDPPHVIRRLRAAEQGEPLARQYVLELLDELTISGTDRRGQPRLADRGELYRLSRASFHQFLEGALRERETLA